MRLPVVATAILLVGVVVWLVLLRQGLTDTMYRIGLPQCLAAHGDCGEQLRDFADEYRRTVNLFGALEFVPLLVGLFWGAPLVAREVEQGTHRLVWTQSISPRRWLAGKLILFGLAAVAVAAVLVGAVIWWNQPFTGIGLEDASPVNGLYRHRGIIPVGTVLYGLAAGVAAGALIRRTVPAMAVAIPAYLVPRAAFGFWQEYVLPAPQVVRYPFAGGYPRGGLGDRQVDYQTIDGAGNPIPGSALTDICPPDVLPETLGRTQNKGIIDTACITAHGIRSEVHYYPVSSFWHLQAVEFGVFAGLAAVALAVAVWWTLRRVS
jgi:hypothetical protein